MSLQEENFEIMTTNQNELRDLEKFYTTNKVDTLLATIEMQKDIIVKDITEFALNHAEIKRDDDGIEISRKIKINPLVISNYFFKSIINISSQEPDYNAEKLGLVFDYYCYIISEVNDKIGDYPPSLSSFCKLAGITTSTFRAYKNSSDLSMRIITEKINDQLGDDNLTMSQMGVVSEKSTIFKLKSQNEMIEKQQPTVHISIVEKPDMERINSKLDKYRKLANKKGNK